MRKGKGFTLIELLVVIAIIGVLTTIVMTSLSTARGKARDARRISDIKQIQLALALYYTDNGMYPDNIYDTSGTPPSVGLAPTYLPVVPIDPSQSGACTTGNQLSCYRYKAYRATSGSACNSSSPANWPVAYYIGALLEDENNSLLASDVDSTPMPTGNACANGSAPFNGLSAGSNEYCDNAAGTAQPGGTERCYSQRP